MKTAASLILCGNLLFGALLIDSWPFAVNPTFATIESDRVPTLLIREVTDTGITIDEVVPLLAEDFHQPFESRNRLRGFLQNIVVQGTITTSQKRLLINTWTIIRGDEKSTGTYEFYRIQLHTNPDLQKPRYDLADRIR